MSHNSLLQYSVSLRISPVIHQTYPGVIICVAQAELPHPLHTQIAAEIELPPHTEIEIDAHHKAFWHDLYRKFGMNPKRNKPSFEALTARYIKNNIIPEINPIVNLYNRLSIKYQIPAGAFDSTTLGPEMELRLSAPGEKFRSIGSEHAEDVPADTVIYCIPPAVITYGWNYRDADFTKVNDDTQYITFVFESAPERKQQIIAAIAELQNYVPLAAITYYET